MEKYYNSKTKTLTLPNNFNKEIDKIPEGTQKIIFCDDLFLGKYSIFNQKIDRLPNSITHLTFGYYFDQKINNFTYIEHLHIWSNYKYINFLPNIIEQLDIYYANYNNKINNLPLNIKKIRTNKKDYEKFIKIPFSCIVEKVDFL